MRGKTIIIILCVAFLSACALISLERTDKSTPASSAGSARNSGLEPPAGESLAEFMGRTAQGWPFLENREGPGEISIQSNTCLSSGALRSITDAEQIKTIIRALSQIQVLGKSDSVSTESDEHFEFKWPDGHTYGLDFQSDCLVADAGRMFYALEGYTQLKESLDASLELETSPELPPMSAAVQRLNLEPLFRTLPLLTPWTEAVGRDLEKQGFESVANYMSRDYYLRAGDQIQLFLSFSGYPDDESPPALTTLRWSDAERDCLGLHVGMRLAEAERILLAAGWTQTEDGYRLEDLNVSLWEDKGFISSLQVSVDTAYLGRRIY